MLETFNLRSSFNGIQLFHAFRKRCREVRVPVKMEILESVCVRGWCLRLCQHCDKQNLHSLLLLSSFIPLAAVFPPLSSQLSITSFRSLDPNQEEKNATKNQMYQYQNESGEGGRRVESPGKHLLSETQQFLTVTFCVHGSENVPKMRWRCGELQPRGD